jgi:hypothetical protein
LHSIGIGTGELDFVKTFLNFLVLMSSIVVNDQMKLLVLRCFLKAHLLVVELAQTGAFASSDILPVVREFENPRHPEFSEKNGWNLYPSCTEVMKPQSPSRQVDGFKALNQVLAAGFN